MGYMGAATGDVATGHLSETSGWQTAIYVWAGWAFAGAAIMAILWNTTSKKVGVLPGYVPKIGAIATLLAAFLALRFGGHSLEMQAATLAAIGCVVVSFAVRVFAIEAFLTAAIALLVVFFAYVRGTTDITWPESSAMIAYALAMITTFMILVERSGEAATCE
jgi:hypothetical protein